MSKYTPGPWIACEYGGYGDYDGKCRVVLGEGGDIRTAVVLGFDTPENEANARLIAAAPDLLDALKEERRIRLIGQSPECGQSHWESMRDLRRAAYEATDAAIEKATGEKA